MLQTQNVFSLFVVVLMTASASPAGQTTVSNPDELNAALATAAGGDEIVIADGTYQDWFIEMTRSGTEEARIILRAQTPGKVVLSGGSRLRMTGDYLTVSGLCFRDGQVDNVIWYMSCNHSRITDCALMDYKDNDHKWVVLEYGSYNRVDHCTLSGKSEHNVTFQIETSESVALNHHQVDHNYFGPRRRGRGNGWETVRNGHSWQQKNAAYNVFEYNLFYECDGENEIISSKSSNNSYRYNTFRKCGGELTLRHGNNNLVEGNYFFGEGKRGSAGIRIIGEGHRVVNNYIEDVRGLGIQIYEGEDGAEVKGYQAGNDILVAFNTVVNNRGNGINVRNYRRTPRNIVIANNLLVGNGQAVCDLSAEQLAATYSFHGNLVSFEDTIGITVPAAAIRVIIPKLHRDDYGVLRPGPDSLVVGVATDDYMNFDFDVERDLDGQARPGKKDVGADQVNGTGESVNRPLDVTDIGGFIGPSWMGKQ